jgi:hypothetical protein
MNNNYYFASQLIADRQAAIAADLAHRTLLREARAARKATAASAGRPTLIRRLAFRRPALATA